MDDVRFHYELIDCEPVASIGEKEFNYVGIASSAQGDFYMKIGDCEEVFDEVPLLIVSTALVNSVWSGLTFMPDSGRKRIFIPDHEPVIELEFPTGRDLSVSLTMASRVIAEASCDALKFLRTAGDFQTSILQRLFDVNPYLAKHVPFLHTFPGASYVAHHWPSAD